MYPGILHHTGRDCVLQSGGVSSLVDASIGVGAEAEGHAPCIASIRQVQEKRACGKKEEDGGNTHASRSITR